MPKLPKILLLAASVTLVVTVFFGMHTTSVSAASGQQDGGAYRQINVYSEVLRHIQSDYVTDPNIDAVTNGALRGLLESLDADSSYLTPADYKLYKADLAKSGKAQVGLVVSKRGGYANIISVIPGSPADKAGLVDGQFIEAINGKDTHDISLAVIQMMLSGTPGSQVTVSVVRGGKPVPDKVELTRAIVTEPPVYESLYEGSSILYLKPVILDHEHVQAIEQKLKSAEKGGGNKKVLLDLRDVAAGDMTEATRLANFFLKSGTIATLEGQKVAKVTYTAEAKQAIDPIAPMVVLVNRGTAGPGELVAAALLDDKRAELVGEKTFGEGTQTKLFELPDGAALILSVAKYGTPSGKKLEDDGVTPGVLVASNIDTSATDGGDEDGGTTTPTPATAKPSADDQLTKGLDLLKNKTV